MKIETYKRLLEEYIELNSKFVKLNDFMDSKDFGELNITDQDLLDKQIGYMADYLHILYLRLDRTSFNKLKLVN